MAATSFTARGTPPKPGSASAISSRALERWLAFPIQRDDQESTAELDVLPGYAFLPSGDAIVLAYGGKIWQLPVAEGAAPREIPFRAQVEREIGPEVRFDYPVEADPPPGPPDPRCHPLARRPPPRVHGPERACM
jgi:hypothetical protein